MTLPDNQAQVAQQVDAADNIVISFISFAKANPGATAAQCLASAGVIAAGTSLLAAGANFITTVNGLNNDTIRSITELDQPLLPKIVDAVQGLVQGLVD